MTEQAAPGPDQPKRTIGTFTATGLVVASMIGGGVFVTTGTLLDKVPSPLAVVICWLIGGLAALCGAMSYAELSVALADNGGEYQYLSKLYHPAVGFVSAWTSLIVGFAAPTAAIAGVFGLYLEKMAECMPFLPALPKRESAAAMIVLLSALNIWRVRAGTGFQNVFTAGKVLLVAGFGVLGLWRGDASRILLHEGVGRSLVSPGFAVGLLVVSFAYTGWGASSYVAGEVVEPARVLPRALVGGTLLVTALYVVLNAAFLAAAPVDALRGKFEVAQVAAVGMFGARGACLISAIILVTLVSTVGAMIVTGPRVYEAVGRDYPRLGWLAVRRKSGGPAIATVVQGAISLALLWVNTDTLLEYIGFTLSITAGLAVAGVFVLRARGVKSEYRMPGYPIVPGLFIALMIWMTASGLIATSGAGLWGLATVASGLVAWRVAR